MKANIDSQLTTAKTEGKIQILDSGATGTLAQVAPCTQQRLSFFIIGEEKDLQFVRVGQPGGKKAPRVSKPASLAPSLLRGMTSMNFDPL